MKVDCVLYGQSCIGQCVIVCTAGVWRCLATLVRGGANMRGWSLLTRVEGRQVAWSLHMVGWMEYELNDQKGAVFIFVLTIFLICLYTKGREWRISKKDIIIYIRGVYINSWNISKLKNIYINNFISKKLDTIHTIRWEHQNETASQTLWLDNNSFYGSPPIRKTKFKYFQIQWNEIFVISLYFCLFIYWFRCWNRYMLRKTDFTELDLIRLCEAGVWERVTSAAVKTVKNPFRNTRFGIQLPSPYYKSICTSKTSFIYINNLIMSLSRN